jgi:hypothetical protein
MSLHDWARVDDGTSHAFHTAWITHLSETLNGGLLPNGYYALPEQHAGRPIADVLTLQSPSATVPPVEEGGLAVETAPPKTAQRITVSPGPRARQRTLAVRHVSGHQIVALVEILSPANKGRRRHVEEFAVKAGTALQLGIHLLMADLFPPRPHDPRRMHAAILECLDDAEPPRSPSPEHPLTVASYEAGLPIEVYLEHLSVGEMLPAMPLFLSPGYYINVPLEQAYQLAFQGMPKFWRDVLEQPLSRP